MLFWTYIAQGADEKHTLIKDPVHEEDERRKSSFKAAGQEEQ